MNLKFHFRKAFADWRRTRNLSQIYHRFREFTMIPEASYLDNLRVAEQIKSVPGCVVECGVWRGGMSAGLCQFLGNERSYFLFDSFEGLPPAKEVDGIDAIRWQNNKDAPGYYDNCSAPPDFAEKAMRLAGTSSFQLMKGWFNETLPNFTPPGPISLLRLDADWYDSTMSCLDHLFDHLGPGGILMLDDYYAWDGCSKAVHDFLSKRSAVERIRSLGDVCYIIKSKN